MANRRPLHSFHPLDFPAHPVVVGVDVSPNGLAATRFALEEAVHRHLPLRIAYATRGGHPHSAVPRMPEGVHRLVVAAHRTYPQLDITERIAPMRPSELLLEEGEDAALLVVGSPSHTECSERAATCTAHIVQDAARCPVVIARPGGAPPPV